MKLNEGALADLHKELWEPLLRYAMRMLGDIALAEDVVQDVFLALWHKEDLPVDTGIRAYLFGAVHRRALHARRTESRIHKREDASIVSSSPGHADSDIRAAELKGVIDRTIAELPERCRDVYQMYESEELTISEIAAAFGITESTVRVQVHRATSAIWKAVEEHLA